MPWYQDPYVYQNSEGIVDEANKPDLKYVKGMYTWLDEHSEIYFIEAFESNHYLPIGDVAIKPENPPIAIGVKTYRGLGIGTTVMMVVIERLKELRFSKIINSTKYKWNQSSIRIHEKLGFIRVDETDNEYIYELNF